VGVSHFYFFFFEILNENESEETAEPQVDVRRDRSSVVDASARVHARPQRGAGNDGNEPGDLTTTL